MWSNFFPVLFLLSLAIANVLTEENDDRPVVETKSGRIKGALYTSLRDKTLEIFHGIPYAKPPIGDLRFSPPVPVDHWEGDLDAQEYGASCFQFDGVDEAGHFKVLEGSSEDCLFLNIWVPHPRPEKAPVLVFIHGSWDYEDGSGALIKYHGGNLASEEGIIVINFNYRLHSFGYLYLDIPEAPGNVALMDQALALKWVHDNVESFGGDPDKITLGGELTGAYSASVHLLHASESAHYKQVLLLDGSAADEDESTAKEGLSEAHQLSDQVGCSTATNDPHKMLSCLREKPAYDIRNVTIKDEKDVATYFGPVVDGHYISDHPYILLKQGKMRHDLKFLLATSHHRAFGINAHYIGQEADEYNYPGKIGFKHLIRTILDKPCDFMINAVLRTYTDWTHPECPAEIRSQSIDFTTDYYYVCPANVMADELTLHGNDVYLGHITQESKRSGLPYWTGYYDDEHLEYILGIAHTENNYTKEEEEFSHHVMDGLANFVRSGNPNGEGITHWSHYNLRNKPYLDIKIGGKTEHFLRARQCEFLNNALPRIKTALDLFDHH